MRRSLRRGFHFIVRLLKIRALTAQEILNLLVHRGFRHAAFYSAGSSRLLDICWLTASPPLTLTRCPSLPGLASRRQPVSSPSTHRRAKKKQPMATSAEIATISIACVPGRFRASKRSEVTRPILP
jgi:hypothetical protein